jgi:hypothetical protein
VEKQDYSEKNRRSEQSDSPHDALRILLGAQRCIRQID